MKTEKTFIPKHRKKVLISNDFRNVIIYQNTTIIEQRILIIILESIKDEQSLFINVKSILGDENERQLSFDEYYEGWANQGVVEFTIPLKHLNPARRMKNSVIQSALINMTNMNWLRLKDEKRDGFKAVPFILEPGWNSSQIYFNMDKAVLKNLLNMSQYYSIKKDLPYNSSSPNTLKFLMWLIKFKKLGFKVIEFKLLLTELYLSKSKYEGRLRFERDYLINVKADLDSFNDLSFNYSFDKETYSFTIYYTKNEIGNNKTFKSLNELQISRSLKYLKKKRSLDEGDLRVLKKFYEIKGHKELSTKLNSKIESNIMGREYIKAVMKELEK